MKKASCEVQGSLKKSRSTLVVARLPKPISTKPASRAQQSQMGKEMEAL
jgi:hypothetical protein